uniref:F-box domain-containing protein n=1 Tax=Rhizophagus irregularis (strain DAOM 181602 / DAOM 197198 / MUCL 43194) TaxID=747089 RepID=U9THS9_RHIID
MICRCRRRRISSAADLELFVTQNVHFEFKIRDTVLFSKSNLNAKDMLLKLFINKNTNFIHLSIPQNLDYELLHISGIEKCFSELESFHCNDVTDPHVLMGLAGICKSIKKLIFDNWYHFPDNYGIIKLIEVQKKLYDISFIYPRRSVRNDSFNKTLEKSLIKHVDTIQYLRLDWKPITNILSYLVNLLSLEINILHFIKSDEANHMENLSLPNLRILTTQRVPSKILVNLIDNTIGNLSEISVFCDGTNNKELMQSISLEAKQKLNDLYEKYKAKGFVFLMLHI